MGSDPDGLDQQPKPAPPPPLPAPTGGVVIEHPCVSGTAGCGPANVGTVTVTDSSGGSIETTTSAVEGLTPEVRPLIGPMPSQPVNEGPSQKGLFGVSFGGFAAVGYGGVAAVDASILGGVSSSGVGGAGSFGTVLTDEAPMPGFGYPGEEGWGYGLAVGLGPGVSKSNAQTFSELKGPFDTTIIATPIITLQFDSAVNDTTRVINWSGPSGLGVFHFRTTTPSWAAGDVPFGGPLNKY